MDDQGAKRHLMTYEELTQLYRDIDKYIADCFPEEYGKDETAFKTVLTSIHQRMRITEK